MSLSCKRSGGMTGGTYCVADGTWAEYGAVDGNLMFVICVNCSTSTGAVPDGILSGQVWVDGQDYRCGRFQKGGRDIGPFYQYPLGSDNIQICGSSYQLRNGRVFLVTPGISPTVKQVTLSIPNHLSDIDSQLRGVCSQSEVKRFLGK